MATTETKYLNPDILAKIRSLKLKAKYVVEGFMSGLHKSPYKGTSVEFAEYRQYMPADDLRYIDWKVFARTDKLYIKEFEDETNVCCNLILDVSESMNYKSKQAFHSKLDYSFYLAASMAYFMLHQRDMVGLATLKNKGIDGFIPPGGSLSHLFYILNTIARVKSEGETSMASSLHQLAERYKKRGIVIIISDLLDDNTEDLINSLKHFRFKGHEVIIFHVLDPDELEFPFDRLTHFIELETRKELITMPDAIRKDYLKELNKFITSVKDECTILDIDYLLMDTQKPIDLALMAYLAKRAGLT